MRWGREERQLSSVLRMVLIEASMCWFVGNAGGESAKGEEKMAHIKNRLRGLLAAFVALVAALAIVPGVAKAAQITNWDGSDGQTVTVKVNNLDETTDTVVVYKVADTTLDTTSNATDVVAVGAVEQQLVDNYANKVEGAVEALYNARENGTVVQNVALSGHSATFQADPGLYVVEVTSTDGSVEFEHTVIAVNPVGHQGEDSQDSYWTVDDVTINMKKSDETLDKTFVYEGDAADRKYVEVGDVLDFTVTFTLGQNNQGFVIKDAMSKGLSYNTESIVMKDVEGEVVASGDVNDVFTLSALSGDENGFQLTFDNDWTLEKDPATGTSANAGTYTLEYKATVTADIENSISNKVSSNVNEEGTTVTDKYGWVEVRKFDDTESNNGTYEVGETLLNDAEFGLYLDAEGNSPVFDKNGSPVTFKTGAISAGVDNEQNVLLKVGTYYIIETKAPAGYKLDKKAYEVVVTEEGGKVAVDAPNIKAGPGEGIELPVTGGAGTVALTAAGVVLVAGAAAFIVRSRKEN